MRGEMDVGGGVKEERCGVMAHPRRLPHIRSGVSGVRVVEQILVIQLRAELWDGKGGWERK